LQNFSLYIAKIVFFGHTDHMLRICIMFYCYSWLIICAEKDE
jgi:hypothetical protein